MSVTVRAGQVWRYVSPSPGCGKIRRMYIQKTWTNAAGEKWFWAHTNKTKPRPCQYLESAFLAMINKPRGYALEQDVVL